MAMYELDRTYGHRGERFVVRATAGANVWVEYLEGPRKGTRLALPQEAGSLSTPTSPASVPLPNIVDDQQRIVLGESARLTQAFVKGQRVQVVGQPELTGAILEGPRNGEYEVLLRDGSERWLAARALEARVRPTFGLVGRDEFLSRLAVTKLNHCFNDVVYSMGSSRTRFLVYQFLPVLKFIQTLPHGLLIADEVGLGKTIEAGLILKEIVARSSVSRVLVVCPANLQNKWHSEIYQRFGFDFKLIKAQDFRDIQRDIDSRGWPNFMAIASIESLRQPDVRNVLDEINLQFDLVIVDEAHHLRNPETRSFELGESLSDHAEHLLLLSATPVQTQQQDLLTLLRLVDPQRFDSSNLSHFQELLSPNVYINSAIHMLSMPNPEPAAIAQELRRISETPMASAFAGDPLYMACIEHLDACTQLNTPAAVQLRHDLQTLHTLAPHFTRTRKREVEQAAVRRSEVLSVALSAAERETYDRIFDDLANAAAGSGTAATWSLITRERQVSSSLHAFIRDHAHLLSAGVIEDIESTDPDIVSRRTDPAGLAQSVVSSLRSTGSRGPSLPQDSKLQALLEALQKLQLQRPGRKILLFTFFKSTLRYLAEELQRAKIPCQAISGDDRPDRRADIVDAFRRSEEDVVLLSTEVGAEGLDFQYCDALINYDLPWNPMRVEQRIGRIDRFGQKSETIEIVSQFVENTIDTRILKRLYDRIQVFESTIGSLEPILGDVVDRLQGQVFRSGLSPMEQEREIEATLQRFETLRLHTAEFEHASVDLLGSEDVVRQQIEWTKASGRYLSPVELEALVTRWLSSLDGGWNSLTPNKQNGIHELRMTDHAVASVRDWIREHRRVNDTQINTLLRRLETGSRSSLHRGQSSRMTAVHCTFDASVAQEHDGLPFIDSGHVLVQMAAEWMESTHTSPESQIGSLAVRHGPAWPYRSILFIYRLEVIGSEARSTVVPVLVDIATGRVCRDMGDQALGSVIAAKDSRELRDGIGQQRLSELGFEAHAYASEIRAEAENEASHTQSARIARQLNALERTYGSKIARSERLLRQAADARIRRLHDGRIRSLTADWSLKRQRLQRSPTPRGTLSLGAIAVLVNQA